MSNRRTLLLLVVLALCACEPIGTTRTVPAPRAAPAARLDTPVDIDRLVSLMTGSFSSAEQSSADPETYTHVVLESCRIWPRRTDGVWLYLERAVAIDPDRPYQQMVARLSLDANGAGRIDTFDLPPDRMRYAGAWRASIPLADLQPSDLAPRDGCVIVVRPEADGMLVGETESDGCASSRGGASYATSSLMVSDDMLVWWDRGFSAQGEQVWGPPYGGYLFRRTDVPVIVKAQPAPRAEPAPSSAETPYQRAADFAARHGGRALVILEQGDLVFEQYDNGHSSSKPHPLASGTVSFWGVLAAAAAQDGLIELDEAVSETISEWSISDGKDVVTIRQLLNFTSGLDPGLRATTDREVPDRFQYAISLAMVAEPGAQFGYGPSHLEVFGELLYRKLLPEPPLPHEYLERRVLAPIGMRVERWHTDEAGNPYMFFGANVTAREWAKLGELIRNGGSRDGRSVIDAERLDECLRGSEARPDFGLGFWLGRMENEGSEIPDDIIRSTGTGQQRLYIIPSRGMVVARLGVDQELPEDEFLRLLLAAE